MSGCRWFVHHAIQAAFYLFSFALASFDLWAHFFWGIYEVVIPLTEEHAWTLQYPGFCSAVIVHWVFFRVFNLALAVQIFRSANLFKKRPFDQNRKVWGVFLLVGVVMTNPMATLKYLSKQEGPKCPRLIREAISRTTNWNRKCLRSSRNGLQV